MRRFISVLSVFFGVMLALPMISYAGEWKQDEAGWRYQNDNGTYQIGWFQDIDGNWYYFDETSTYMLFDTITPDGYKVSTDGKWLQGDDEKIDFKGFDNKVELQVTSYDSPYGPEALGYTVPTVVYYNNEYVNIYGGNLQVTDVAVSKDGLAYLEFNVDKSEMYELLISCRYFLEDGTYIDIDENMVESIDKPNEKLSYQLLKRIRGVRRDSQKVNPVSVEIYINEKQ